MTDVERGRTFGFDVNICDNINHIPRGGPAPLPLSFFPSLVLSPSLSPVKIKVRKGDVKGE